MTKLQLQFHGEGSETLGLAAHWAGDYGLRLAAEQFFPQYRVQALESRDQNEIPVPGKIRRVALGRGEFDLSAASTHEFVALNPGCLFVSVQCPTEEGLRESALGGVTNDEELLQRWRRLIRGARATMHRGAVIRSPLSDMAHPAPAHLHTIEAHKLAENGVRMLAVAGQAEYVFQDLLVSSVP